MPKTAILIGYGGMGRRYYQALKLMKIKTIAVCEKKIKKISKEKFEKNVIITNDYKKLLKLKADLLCIASNTQSRFQILSSFSEKGKIKKIITEKPLSTSYGNCLRIQKIIKRKKIKLIVNTHRSFSPNFLMLKKIFKKYKETPSTIFINSPSAGLGNMGSTFFDLGFFFFNEKPKSVVGNIDKTGTINPRGKNFKDPGGHGIISFYNNKKLFFDLSENTGLPYTISIKSKNLEATIDEINNNFILKQRPKIMNKKPLYFYLFKPRIKKLKIKHKFDVVRMTCFSIRQIFENKFSYKNLDNAVSVMGCIFAVYASNKENKIVSLPLHKRYHKFKINFA
tara:strand:- start:3475 stop:4488 length:1014 start_codon:yes stop_codon:yes gene_type:complete